MGQFRSLAIWKNYWVNLMPRRRQRSYRRRVNTREIRQRFLIVCEGEKTEPNYFKSFRTYNRLSNVQIEIIGIGENTIKLVQKAEKLKEQGDYDQVWCVFDKDDFPPEDFNNAISSAQSHGIRVAYSNEAFELWYLLHYDYINTAMSRYSYQNKLTQRLKESHPKKSYQKNDTQMYEILRDKQETAIRNAEKLLRNYGDNHNPANDNPCTTVHLLVQELNRFAV